MTLLTLSMPWQFAALIFPVCVMLFRLLAYRVRTSMQSYPLITDCADTATSGIVWLYACAATAVVLAPLPERLPALLSLLFLFRLTLTDALNGLLPRILTVSFLLAGLAASLWHYDYSGLGPAVAVLSKNLFYAIFMMLIAGGFRLFSLSVHGYENPASGDVWLSGAICAWLGLRGFHAVVTGFVLFMLWQVQLRRTSEGGPLGPWLAAGAVMVTLFQLYQPLITW
ncbi:potassium transporter TrkH [Pantoea agglomerans]|uniref:potassium transporter TrkH n=1 Tax=Enterobacter agglomerans TaxID=549 RepID=UPI002892A253|nr:potassium transporter TrkH [Pantoea agglomerans]WNK30370.1 potassium transporter TrkH [Pantoea agglomerans]